MPSAPERLQSHLEPGERLLWHGSPDPKWFSWPSAVRTLGSTRLVVSLLAGALLAGPLVWGDAGALLDQVRSWSVLALTTHLVGLLSFAVLRSVRRYPHLHRLSRPMALGLVRLGVMLGSRWPRSTERGFPWTT